VEERGRLVGLVEGCVRACVEGEKQKSSAGDKGRNGDGEVKDEMVVDAVEEGEGGREVEERGVYEALRETKGRDDWLVRSERFMVLAAETAGKSSFSHSRCISA
jgi:nucleolar pre-ribosomal-associated protein 1